MADTFLSLPEFFENDIGESLLCRTETLGSFRELGPPDLCHVLKSNGRKEVGSYHYVSGVDASSSATLATYITSLAYEMEHHPAWFSSKSPYKLKGGVYCCFNAISRVDLRVEVCIPGSVQTYVVNVRGERQEATPEIWQETYLSAVLRAILYADDANYRLAGYRKLDPIPTLEHEFRFLLAAENLFFKGWQLGSEPEIQVATIVHNHLSAGILKYFGESSRYEQAVNLFEKLWAREPEVAALVAKSYLGMNQEVKAVQIMHRSLQQNPHSYVLLHVQCDFLRKKGQLDWAIRLANQAVSCAPSEFVTWAKLADCLVDAGEWSAALFTLNSCPMFTYNERDLHRIPEAARTHFPIRPLAAQSKLLDEDSANDNEADVALLRLPAPALRGTFASAYGILTKLANKIGWDELLKCRSEVFVMEEEYRTQNPSQEEVKQGEGSEKSGLMQQPEAAGAAEENGALPKHRHESGHWLSFTDKRLCERWLDNLFMVLYEDLRVYTIWRAELAHYQAQSMPFRKTGTDWEILGELALRLHHPEEAHEAFLQCIGQKFSPKAYQRLLEHCVEINNLEQCLSMALYLTAYNYRWYTDCVFPGAVATSLFKLINTEGLSKVSNTLISMKPPPAMLRLMQRAPLDSQAYHGNSEKDAQEDVNKLSSAPGERGQTGENNDLERGPVKEGEYIDDAIPTELPDGLVDAKKAKGCSLVQWDNLDDQELATNWSSIYRWYVTMMVCVMTVTSTIVSSAPSQLLTQLSEHYQVSEEVIKVAVFVFLAGYIFGPIFWGPLSELYGTRLMLFLSGIGATVFNVVCAHSPNIGSLIVFRFLAGVFGSCPLAIGGGVMVNIWHKEIMGIGMAIFASAPMAGPALGPLVAGWISISGTTFQWVFWSMAMFSGVITFIVTVTVLETNPGVNLVKKAKRLRKQTGNDRLKAPFEVRKIDIKELATNRLITPVLMLMPMLFAITLYVAFVYGVLYLFFDAYPVVFVEHHGLNPVLTGCTFLPFLVGCVLGTVFYAFFENKIYLKRLNASPTDSLPPEFRIRSTIYGAPILVISLFWFAWTCLLSGSRIWSPIVAGGFFGLAIFFIMFSLFTYLADTYKGMTASAIAANTMVRSAFGVGFPLFSTQMYHKLGPPIATTVLACIAVVMLPIPFVLYKFGPYLRSKSRYAA